jgi:hypothetical protein
MYIDKVDYRILFLQRKKLPQRCGSLHIYLDTPRKKEKDKRKDFKLALSAEFVGIPSYFS